MCRDWHNKMIPLYVSTHFATYQFATLRIYALRCWLSFLAERWVNTIFLHTSVMLCPQCLQVVHRPHVYSSNIEHEWRVTTTIFWHNPWREMFVQQVNTMWELYSWIRFFILIWICSISLWEYLWTSVINGVSCSEVCTNSYYFISFLFHKKNFICFVKATVTKDMLPFFDVCGGHYLYVSLSQYL
jgi:hypothetical protein